MDNKALHAFLREATIRLCDLPEPEIVELDKELVAAHNEWADKNL